MDYRVNWRSRASSVYKAADPRLEGSMINYSNRGVVLQLGYSFF